MTTYKIQGPIAQREYLHVYFFSKDKKEFIKKMEKSFPHLEITSINRYYRDCKRIVDGIRSGKMERKTNDIIVPIIKEEDIKEEIEEEIEEDNQSEDVVIKDIPNNIIEQDVHDISFMPSYHRLMLFEDLKKHYGLIPRHILEKYGFSEQEMEWFKKEGKF